MKCPECQTENPEARRFCRECGVKLILLCPQCGSENLPVDKFCGECGHVLIKPTESYPIDYNEPQSYTPKHLADKILTTRSAIEGERKIVTVLFADMADSTAMFENLDPEDVHQIMDGCFKIFMDEIHRYEGTINQFLGDGVMALFGAPIAHEDHAQRACHASLAIQNALVFYADQLKKECGIDFKMRRGLNSGPVVVGSIGDDLRMDYTADGDVTNLASRMESLAKPGSIVLSKYIHRLVKDYFEFESLGKVEVKGKAELQEIHELTKTSEVKTRIEAAVTKGLTRFVGRKNSMSALMTAFDKIKSGSGQVVGLVGEAGVGKSRLLHEMKNLLPQGEHIYLVGRCLHYGGSMTYRPILDVLRAYFEIKEGDQEPIIKKKMKEKVLDIDENLGGILPALHELLSLKVDDEVFIKLEPKEKRERIFEAIRDLLIRVSQENPLVLAIEDLHWVDKTSEEFLDYLIGWLAKTPILLILLYRPEYTHQWGSKSYYTKVGVNQLGTSSSTELVQAILDEQELASELKQLILDRTGGNPLFMEEFTNILLENDSIERKDKKYVLSGKAKDIQVPDNIQGIIAARMDRLEGNLKQTLQVASVIGRDFAFRVLQAITQMREELKSYLLNLQGLEFIYEKRLFPELEYLFKHALIQEVAYTSLLAKRRSEIHESIGKAIESLYPETLEKFYEVLAYHYSRSENLQKAYQYLDLSAKKALNSYALWEAFHYYNDAVKTLNKMPDTIENKEAQIRERLAMAKVMIPLAFPENSHQLLQQGRKLSEELDNQEGAIQFKSLEGFYYAIKGADLGLGIAYMEESFGEAKKLNKLDFLAPIAMDLCISYHFYGSYPNTINIASNIISMLEKAQRKFDYFKRPYNPYAILCSYSGLSLDQMGNFEEGNKQYEKGIYLAGEVHDLHSLSLLELNHGMGHNIKGEGEDAIKHLQNCIRYCEEGRTRIYLGLAWSGMGWSYTLLGENESARKHIEKGLELHQAADIPYLLSMQYLLLGSVYINSDDLPMAQKYIKKALQFSQQIGEKWVEGLCLIFLGRILGKVKKEDSERAEQFIKQGIRILSELKMKPYCAQGFLILAEFYLSAGSRLKALRYLLRARMMFKQMGMDYWLLLSKQAS